jgi:hypothetical protein
VMRNAWKSETSEERGLFWKNGVLILPSPFPPLRSMDFEAIRQSIEGSLVGFMAELPVTVALDSLFVLREYVVRTRKPPSTPPHTHHHHAPPPHLPTACAARWGSFWRTRRMTRDL